MKKIEKGERGHFVVRFSRRKIMNNLNQHIDTCNATRGRLYKKVIKVNYD